MLQNTTPRLNLAGKMNCVIWSDVFFCNPCEGELVFWEVAIDHKDGRALDTFECPHCKAFLSKRELKRASYSYTEPSQGIDKTPKKVPVEINYSLGNKSFKKHLDDFVFLDPSESR